MCAHVGEQVHVCTRLHASHVECFPWVPGSELRTSCTLLIDHLQAPQISVPARHLMRNHFGLCLASEGTRASFFSHVARSALDEGAGGIPWITSYSGLKVSFPFLLIPPKYTLPPLLTINKQKKIKL